MEYILHHNLFYAQVYLTKTNFTQYLPEPQETLSDIYNSI